MMTKFSGFLSVLCAIGLTAQGQTDVQYAELIGQGGMFSDKLAITVDFGEDLDFPNALPQKIRDENSGRVIRFHSMAGAMNFMATQGWQFVQAYVTKRDDVTKEHWIIKRKYQPEEEPAYRDEPNSR